MGKGTLLFGVAVGALAVYYLDPQSGARRRNTHGDKLRSLTGSAVSTAQNQATRAANKTQGGFASVAYAPDNPTPDDQTLRDRVESEIFRNPETSREHININVVNGVVTVRGEQPNQAAIDALVTRIRSIPHVRGVENLLHLPGTEAPNKEAAIEASHSSNA